MTKVCMNGRFIEEKNAKVPVSDRGFLYGDGAFETMRAYAGAVYMLERHIARLFDALRTLRIKAPCGGNALAGLVRRSLAVNDLESAYVRVTVTRGQGRFGIAQEDSCAPNLIIVARPFGGYPAWVHEKGIAAAFAPAAQNDRSPLSRVKSCNYLPYILARFDARDAGCDEAVMVNTRGRVTEAATSNVFLVKHGRLATPSVASGILPGIARQAVIDIARRLRIPVAERAVMPAELVRADEAFLTNSLAEIIPLVRIGRRRIGVGRPGPVTRLLHLSYQKQVIASSLRK